MTINGETKLIGFFGATYRTSKMYTLYNAAIDALGINYKYVPFVVGDLATALAGVRHLGIAAVGVTIPYKVDIIAYLDELDTDAHRIGAVNVVANQNGRLIGGNTDGRGAVRALQEQTDPAGKRVALLGAGGSTRAIAFSLLDAQVDRLTILNRTPSKAHDLAAQVGDTAVAGGYDELERVVPATDILINTTPVGMADTPHFDQSIVPARLLRPGMTVMDIVGKPQRTRLLRDAEQAGCRLVFGDRMLLWQAVAKFRTYTGVEPPIEVMAEAMATMRAAG